jgi:hypothetical protein
MIQKLARKLWEAESVIAVNIWLESSQVYRILR